MKLKNGKSFPSDYLPQEEPPTKTDREDGVRRYRHADPDGTTSIHEWEYPPAGARRTERLEHDAAYRAITEAINEYDLRTSSDRIEFIALVTAALAVDPWGYVSDIAMRMVDNLDKINKMDELEEFNRRLSDLEIEAKRLRQITDDPDLAVMDAREAGTSAPMEQIVPPRSVE